MALLNWDEFERLPGAVTANFEHLCRCAIRIQYERFGRFSATANQPGIEFDLHLTQDCLLGKAGDWFGWQCKWYAAIASGKAIGTKRRKEIAEGLKKSLAENPKLTHWVLWTRHTLTKGDQKWFYSLFVGKTVVPQLKTADDLEPLLGGEAAYLKNTYFGDLVLTPERLIELHAASVASIRQRWIPEVHSVTEAEARIRRMLGDVAAWERLSGLADSLKAAEKDHRDDKTVSARNKPLVVAVAESCTTVRTTIVSAIKALEDGDVNAATTKLTEHRAADKSVLGNAVRKLRNERLPLAVVTTNAVAEILEAESLLTELQKVLRGSTIAVVADAGEGKTHMAVSVTSADSKRPAGILLFGQALTAKGTLNDLAKRLTICGAPVPGMESLLAALDSAGQRSKCRLALVIDGLNEAEDARQWKAELAAITETIKKYPYALLVCTVRSTDFADEALPEDWEQLEANGFEQEPEVVAKRYFEYFKIDARDVDVPDEILRHPLSLRLFCEVANPSRKKVVGLEAVPGSLTEMFLRFIGSTADRIQQLSSLTQRYFAQDVLSAINRLGLMLWEKRSRSVDESEFRKAIGDDTRPWDRSIVRALEQEGLIIRVLPQSRSPLYTEPRKGLRTRFEPDIWNDSPNPHVAPVFDALAGHIIADARASELGRKEMSDWLSSDAAVESFVTSSEKSHPLAGDIFHALIGVIPSRHPGSQFWKLINPGLIEAALLGSIRLVAKSLDEESAEAIKKLIVRSKRTATPKRNGSPFNRLLSVRSANAHPLNADFLDSVLRSLGNADRDLIWSEWLMSQEKELLEDVRRLQRDWQSEKSRRATDHLRAKWVMWLFTTNVRDLRDEATKALYWYGRNAPRELLILALESLSISDPYVPERTLAALYGVAMHLHGDNTQRAESDKVLVEAAKQLYAAMFSANAPHSTTHILMRDYARHTIELGLIHDPKCLTAAQIKEARPPFPSMPRMAWTAKPGVPAGLTNGPIRMDFGNYTIGRLIENRANYQTNHPEYQRVMAEILWRIEDLGYQQDRFEDIERDIGEGQYGRMRWQRGKTDRYGKKYSWTAFFEMAGRRLDEGNVRESYGESGRISDCDIDPSFPEPKTTTPIIPTKLPAIAGELRNWLAQKVSPDLDYLLKRKEVNGIPGDWVLLNGYFHQQDRDQGVGLFCRITGMVVTEEVFKRVRKHLKAGHSYDIHDISIPEFHYTFVGEAGWSDTFPAAGAAEWNFVVGHEEKMWPKMSFLEDEETHDSEPEMEIYREQIYETVNVLLPVVGNGWESYHTCTNPGRNPALIGREICEELKLSVDQQTCEFRDKDGKIASAVVSIHDDNDEAATQDFAFLRKDLLEKLLKDRKSRLLWFVWGERECVSENMEFLRTLYDTHGSPEDFQSVRMYPTGREL